MTKTYRIAVIPGDGIGKEVVPEGMRALEAAASHHGFALQADWFDFASCDYYEKHGRMMPEDWKGRIGGHDAIYFGAVGWPAKVPDHISLWGSLVLFRREFDQYVNLRPVRLMPGVASPLANRKPGDIDFMVVRENTEGEYSAIGGRMFGGTEREVVVQPLAVEHARAREDFHCAASLCGAMTPPTSRIAPSVASCSGDESSAAISGSR